MNVIQEYQTWFEAYLPSWEFDIVVIRENIFKAMVERSPEKYQSFLKNVRLLWFIWKLFWVPHAKHRQEFFDRYYTWRRFTDEVVDGDSPNVISWDNYRVFRSEVAQVLTSQSDSVFWTLKKTVFQVMGKVWMSEEVILFSSEKLANSLLFDGDRLQKFRETWSHQIFSKDILSSHYHSLDIVGTITPTLELFWIESNYWTQILIPLWIATRIAYTLDDLEHELSRWLCNIPDEAISKYAISPDQLHSLAANKSLLTDKVNENIIHWIEEELYEMQKLLDEHYVKMENLNFDLTFSHSDLKKRLYNWVLKNIILKKWYIEEIERVRRKFRKWL